MRKALYVIIILSTVSLLNAVFAWPLQEKLTGTNNSDFAEFGHSVSVNGNYAIVGAHLDGENASRAGAAYVFYYDVNDWVQQAKLMASDGASHDNFGSSVYIEGDYAVVGAVGDDSYAGSAYIFKREASNWIEVDKIIASDASSDSYFGCSVSMSGYYVIVGAYGNDYSSKRNSGSVYIFTPDFADPCDWHQTAEIYHPQPWADDYFGFSVSIDGDYAVIGAYGDNDKGVESGSVFIFKRDGVDWIEQDKLLASDGASNDNFGSAVFIEDDIAVIGSKGDDTQRGSAYIFQRDGSDWSQQFKLTAYDGSSNDRFGSSVSKSGIYLTIGADGDDDSGSESGSAYIFKFEDGNWNQHRKLIAGDGSPSDWFGYSVSINEEKIIVGAYGDDDKGGESGSAYVFSRELCPSFDLNDDCYIDFDDIALLTSQWLDGDN